ncbi:MAG: 3-hydroxyacyl-[acyl-carrier-protein] dehydratase FabZ [Rhodospirillaceae bacterium]|nr:3-hydroxyacyl-[acyl-carrier-protein] dehydratase FabZ [Rhodospirillaceae bacterium]|tara:strand:+ start:1561 stop:2040 length:480 start_codon:yes stop_codon:yes gene_type:complete
MKDNKGAELQQTIDVSQIMSMIPHRYPFLLVDRICEIRADHSAIGLKNVTYNEPFFQGHFPVAPVMPGVLIIESMAQTSALLVVHTLGGDANGKLVYFMSIDGARFRKPVVPGDQLLIHAVKRRNRGNVWKLFCEAKVAETLVAEAIITAMISDEEVKR